MFKHCKEEGLSYLQHFRQAIRYFWIMQKAAFCVLVHAFIPSFFETTASRKITSLAIHFYIKSKAKDYKNKKSRVR
jgi:hypothetical protein